MKSHAQAPIRVVCVDDHEVVLRGIEAGLNLYDDIELVAKTTDPRAALHLCHNLQPHVLLVDLVMPGMTGVQLIQQIMEYIPVIKVIALTSFAEETLIEAALAAGATSYLLKQIPIDELAQTIRLAYQGQPTLAPEVAGVLIRRTVEPQEETASLTPRECEVLHWMVQGFSNAQIAARLVISRSTVKNHVSSILAKMGASTRTQAVIMALEDDKLLPSNT